MIEVRLTTAGRGLGYLGRHYAVKEGLSGFELDVLWAIDSVRENHERFRSLDDVKDFLRVYRHNVLFDDMIEDAVYKLADKGFAVVRDVEDL